MSHRLHCLQALLKTILKRRLVNFFLIDILKGIKDSRQIMSDATYFLNKALHCHKEVVGVNGTECMSVTSKTQVHLQSPKCAYRSGTKFCGCGFAELDSCRTVGQLT